MNLYEHGLDKNAANFVALTPISFVERSAEVFGDLEAVVHGRRRYTWRETRDRAARLAAALKSLGVGRGTTVSTMLHNTPEMVEAHYAVPAPERRCSTRSTRGSTLALHRLAAEPLRDGSVLDHRPRARADDRPRRSASCARRHRPRAGRRSTCATASSPVRASVLGAA